MAMADQAQVESVNLGKVYLEALLGGNPYAIGIAVVGFVIGFLVVGNKYFPDQLNKILKLFGKSKYENMEAQERHLLKDMYGILFRAQEEVYVENPGRNALYVALSKFYFNGLYNTINSFYLDQQDPSKKNWKQFKDKEEHLRRFDLFRQQFRDTVRAELATQGWTKEKIEYVIQTFHQKICVYNNFFEQAINTCVRPYDFIQIWFLFATLQYAKMVRDYLHLNGQLAGQQFNGIEIK